MEQVATPADESADAEIVVLADANGCCVCVILVDEVVSELPPLVVANTTVARRDSASEP